MVAMADSFYKANITMGKEEIIFNSTEIMVDPNDEVHLHCGMKGNTEPQRQCVWTNNNASYQVLDVYQGVYSSKGKPENTEGNQCGIILKEIKNEDHGGWKCSIYISGRTIADTKTVIVTVKPTEVSVPQKVTANIGDDTLVKCTVGKARPPATITWTLNDRDITTEAKEEFLPNVKLIKTTIKVKVNDTEASEKGNSVTGDREKDTDEEGEKEVEQVIEVEVYSGDNKTISTLSHNFTENENHQELKCIINHPRLENPEIHIMPVTVGIAPTRMKEKTFYNISMNSTHTIEFNYTAFPKPTVNKWKVGSKTYPANSTDNKIETSLYEIENGTYLAELIIFGLEEDDYKNKYTFQVENEISTTLYNFNISMHPKPKEAGGNSVNSAWLLYSVLSILALFL